MRNETGSSSGSFPLDTSLRTKEEICAFCRQDWRTIKRLIKEENFPAVKDGKFWKSDMILISNWQRKRIEQTLKT